MKRKLLVALIFSCALLYACDYLSLRYRIPRNRAQFGSVQVQRYYAVRMKNRKTEYMYDQPGSQTCVHSLFPHFGNAPCWYLERHKAQRVDME